MNFYSCEADCFSPAGGEGEEGEGGSRVQLADNEDVERRMKVWDSTSFSRFQLQFRDLTKPQKKKKKSLFASV